MCNKCKGGPETTSHSAISGHEVLSVLFPFFTKKYVNPQKQTYTLAIGRVRHTVVMSQSVSCFRTLKGRNSSWIVDSSSWEWDIAGKPKGAWTISLRFSARNLHEILLLKTLCVGRPSASRPCNRFRFFLYLASLQIARAFWRIALLAFDDWNLNMAAKYYFRVQEANILQKQFWEGIPLRLLILVENSPIINPHQKNMDYSSSMYPLVQDFSHQRIYQQPWKNQYKRCLTAMNNQQNFSYSTLELLVWCLEKVPNSPFNCVFFMVIFIPWVHRIPKQSPNKCKQIQGVKSLKSQSCWQLWVIQWFTNLTPQNISINAKGQGPSWVLSKSCKNRIVPDPFNLHGLNLWRLIHVLGDPITYLHRPFWEAIFQGFHGIIWSKFSASWIWRVYSHRIHGTGIFTYIWLKFMVNVDKHTIHGSYGIFWDLTPEPLICNDLSISGMGGKTP